MNQRYRTVYCLAPRKCQYSLFGQLVEDTILLPDLQITSLQQKPKMPLQNFPDNLPSLRSMDVVCLSHLINR